MSEDKIDGSDLIDPNDFKSVQLIISVSNMTAGTEFKEGKYFIGGKLTKTEPGFNPNVFLQEFAEKGMILDVPAHSFASGHAISVNIKTENTSEQIDFDATGKVGEVTAGEGRDQVTMNMVQYKTEDWDKLKSVYSSRQEDILNFFQNVKG